MRFFSVSFLSLVFFLVFLSPVKAQYVVIPDVNFRTYLEANFPTCMQGGMMDTTCAAIVNARELNPMSKNIADITGVQYFDKLERLYCYNNQITFLPPLPSGLIVLWCGMNQLITLPTLPVSLDILECGENQLISLPVLPPLLTDLYCENNRLVNLPTLPQLLTVLFCGSNQLTILPILPPALDVLKCSNNQLTILPALPATIRDIQATANQLTLLPTLPQGLENLYCAGNLLSDLPQLPATLINLGVSSNQLTSLPYLPTGLKYLGISQNKITDVPVLPETLIRFHCRYNQITCLPVLPNELIELVTDSICRPNLPSGLTLNVPWNQQLCSALLFTHTRVCAGDSTGFVLKDANCHAFLWDFDDPVTGANNTSTLQNPKHLFSKPGTFNVKLISYVSNPATVITQSVVVDKFERIDFGDDHSMCPDDAIVLDAGSKFKSYLWQDGSNAQAYNVQSAGMYVVTASNACGSATESIQLSDYALTIPNLFTPNSDGLNDTFEIKGLDGDSGSLYVYNSWGTEVYHADSYYNNWEGEELSEGLYYYSFSLKTCPVQKNWLQIIR